MLGDTATATISQPFYSGAYTFPANPTTCKTNLAINPVSVTISGTTLSVQLGDFGVTGTCSIAVTGAAGTTGTEVVDLAVPAQTPAPSAPVMFSTDPVIFSSFNALEGSSKTVTVSETNYSGAFTLDTNPVSCTNVEAGITPLTASIANGNQLTLAVGVLNGNFIGTCTIAVLDADLRKGFMTADFELI